MSKTDGANSATTTLHLSSTCTVAGCVLCRPAYKSSACPHCYPRCPHGYPADVPPTPAFPAITWTSAPIFTTTSAPAPSTFTLNGIPPIN